MKKNKSVQKNVVENKLSNDNLKDTNIEKKEEIPRKNLTLKIFEILENFGLWILEKIHLNFLSKFYKEHIEGMRYLVCGALSTVVNILAYAIAAKLLFISIPENATFSIFTIVLSLRVTISDTFAFIIALIFAYWVNKMIVFNSKCDNIKELIKEMTSFTSCRIFTQIISLAMMNFAVVINMNDVIMKIIANIVVIILNFILSKLIIFKK